MTGYTNVVPTLVLLQLFRRVLVGVVSDIIEHEEGCGGGGGGRGVKLYFYRHKARISTRSKYILQASATMYSATMFSDSFAWNSKMVTKIPQAEQFTMYSTLQYTQTYLQQHTIRNRKIYENLLCKISE